jgi:hypothetical protein
MAKRSKPSRTELSEEQSREDERVLNRLLALLSGRSSEVDWEPLVGKEQRG